ncbi:MAG TPA: YkgJ family cysteine cluster protein [Thermoanaerobaculia bacterium]|nr:YkgJ family cysteine cluster protein [Thermoanaerobaculia bacterium]
MIRRRIRPRHELDLDRADRRLLAVVEEAMSEAVHRAATESGSWLACRPGCTECCHGTFPVNRLDARRLRQGLAELAAQEPERARAVAARADAQIPRLREGFPGDPETGIFLDDDEAAEPYFTRHGALPCPVLDPETGCCDLYAWRPLTCRTFGPPVQIGESALPPCHLCFQGASDETVHSCRVEPDPHGVEDRIVARLGEEETLIAFVLAEHLHDRA